MAPRPTRSPPAFHLPAHNPFFVCSPSGLVGTVTFTGVGQGCVGVGLLHRAQLAMVTARSTLVSSVHDRFQAQPIRAWPACMTPERHTAVRSTGRDVFASCNNRTWLIGSDSQNPVFNTLRGDGLSWVPAESKTSTSPWIPNQRPFSQLTRPEHESQGLSSGNRST